MSWKDYQQELTRGTPKRSKKRQAGRGKPKNLLARNFIFVGGAGVLILATYLFFSYENRESRLVSSESTDFKQSHNGSKDNESTDSLEVKKPIDIRTVQSEDEWREFFRTYLDWRVLEHARNEVILKDENNLWNVKLTVNEKLQTYIQSRLARYDVDWGAVSIVDTETGAVLALTSYSNKQTKRDFSLKASFPAASVFKVITTAAAVDKFNWQPESSVRYRGDYRYVTPSNIKKGGNNLMKLNEAFAKSINIVFAKIGVHILGDTVLEEYAKAFAFNRKIPFDMKLEESRAQIDADEVLLGKTSAGLGKVSLNPIHGALIPACVSNNGKMMSPWIVSRVINDKNIDVYNHKPKVLQSCISKASVSRLKKIMAGTIQYGTARKSFKGYQTDSVLKKLNIGGKTGSKTNMKLKGWNEWFVGYAEGAESKISLSVVLVSEKKWKVKPATLSRELIKYYFKNKLYKDKKAPRTIDIGVINERIQKQTPPLS